MNLDPLGLAEDIASAKAKLIIGAVIALALVAGVAWYGEWRADAARADERNVWQAAVNKQKAEASAILAAETGKVLAAERDLAQARQLIEVQDHEREQTATAYEKRLVALAAGNAGRLRDPAGRGAGGDAAPGPGASAAGGGAAGAAQASGLLSVPLTELLQRLVREAGEQSDAYAACRADDLNLRKALTASPPSSP